MPSARSPTCRQPCPARGRPGMPLLWLSFRVGCRQPGLGRHSPERPSLPSRGPRPQGAARRGGPAVRRCHRPQHLGPARPHAWLRSSPSSLGLRLTLRGSTESPWPPVWFQMAAAWPPQGQLLWAAAGGREGLPSLPSGQWHVPRPRPGGHRGEASGASGVRGWGQEWEPQRDPLFG